ncbi:MAG: agmatine deiminase family protein [Proteobacteria bacterium]|nr:agmatine deiminase family protein [Pseudomonadota bacterium]
MKYIVYPLFFFSMVFLNNSTKAEVIVLAAPATHIDSHYDEVSDDIFDFHISYAKLIEEHGDHAILLTNQEYYKAYVKELGGDKVIMVPMLDIWMRDFTILNMVKPVMFRYSAAGQGNDQDSADEVQEVFADFAKEAGLIFSETDLINDGGNFVDDYAGNVVISRKFLRDNQINKSLARQKISALTNAKRIAFIEADEQGGLEHSDGVVSFIEENVLIINSYPEDPEYAKQLKADLESSLPGVKIHEIVTAYDNTEVYDKRFGSACGLYTNALVTPERIYFPQFGIPEDRIALDQIKTLTKKEVVPVPSGQVCHMGGGVRCMSLQLRGENASRLLKYARDN